MAVIARPGIITAALVFGPSKMTITSKMGAEYGYSLLWIVAVAIIGATVAIVFGKLHLELIVLAQSVTIFIVPFIGIARYAIANDAQIMGSSKNPLAIRIIGAVGLRIFLFLAFMDVKNLFFK